MTRRDFPFFKLQHRPFGWLRKFPQNTPKWWFLLSSHFFGDWLRNNLERTPILHCRQTFFNHFDLNLSEFTSKPLLTCIWWGSYFFWCNLVTVLRQFTVKPLFFWSFLVSWTLCHAVYFGFSSLYYIMTDTPFDRHRLFLVVTFVKYWKCVCTTLKAYFLGFFSWGKGLH